MPKKRVIYGEEARSALMRGVDTIANAVRSTLGPRGRNVIIGQREFGKTPRITKDGVTVANWVDVSDPVEQLGADLAREASQKTMDTCGDGTTTAIVLAQAMCRAGFERVRRGAAPFVLRRGMERACEAYIEEIKAKAVPVDVSKVEEVARQAANGDSAIAGLVADAVGRIGRDGVLTIESSGGSESAVEVIPGLQVGAGYISQAFITNVETLRCEFDNPRLLLWEGKITSARALGHVLGQAASAHAPLVVICGDIESEALGVLVANRLRNQIQSVAVRMPVYGERRRETYRDIAAITGNGGCFLEEGGRKLETVELRELPTARKVSISSQRTIIEGDSHGFLGGRIEAIREQLRTAKPDDKPYLEARLAGLTGGIAVIKVGGVTETQVKERRDRVEDAMFAAKAALEMGIVPGGGVALIRAAQAGPFDEIVRPACFRPAAQIAENAGLNGDDWAHRISAVYQAGYGYSTGYNAATDAWEDLMAAGVVDPAKVVIECLRNAVAVAGELICTDACVITEPEAASVPPAL